MKKELDETFKVYAVLAANAIPQIPCIDAFTFAKELGKGQPINAYMSHLLACSEREFAKIGLILISHGYDVDHIETFDYGQKGNEYVYFKIKA